MALHAERDKRPERELGMLQAPDEGVHSERAFECIADEASILIREANEMCLVAFLPFLRQSPIDIPGIHADILVTSSFG